MLDSSTTSTIDTIFSIGLIVAPLLLGMMHHYLTGKKIIELIFLYYIFVGIGIQGIASGIMQAFYPNDVIQYVHWPYSPFIRELGLANISYGVLGILSPFMSRGWQTATAFGYALFLLGTGMRHLIEIWQQGLNPGNSGAFAYVDFIMAFILFVLLALRLKSRKTDVKVFD